jgi:chromate reductase, NAD(P)H dehydrogenase (quinone)
LYEDDIVKVVSISGSLRELSSNTALLQAAERLALPGMAIERYRDFGALPHFNPDLEADPPAVILALRERMDACDALLISCPEYARGIPGAFKNMLDWLVGSPHFRGKKVALFNASPRATAAQEALRLVLTTMAAEIVEGACITIDLLSRKLDAEAIAADPGLSRMISEALEGLLQSVGAKA